MDEEMGEDFDIKDFDMKEENSLLLPEKSKLRYEQTYIVFKKWLDDSNGKINEKTMLTYFGERCKTLKSPGSLWALFSMLKSMIYLKEGINIGDYKSLISLLKKKNVGYKPKKSKIFRREDINRFLTEAPDEIYLMMKVAMIVGIAGACRREELIDLTVDDIEDRGSVIIVKKPSTKKYVHRTFTIVDKPEDDIPLLDIFRKYYNLRPPRVLSRRFFIRYTSGKCANQVVGINTMGRIPSAIARYLKLPDPHSYTGHAFRRTSVTLLADIGVDILGLKKRIESYAGEGFFKESADDARKILHQNRGMYRRASTSEIPPGLMFNRAATAPSETLVPVHSFPTYPVTTAPSTSAEGNDISRNAFSNALRKKMAGNNPENNPDIEDQLAYLVPPEHRVMYENMGSIVEVEVSPDTIDLDDSAENPDATDAEDSIENPEEDIPNSSNDEDSQHSLTNGPSSNIHPCNNISKPTSPPAKPPKNVKIKKRRKKDMLINDLIAIMKENSQVQTSATSQNCVHDETEMFFLSLAKNLKKLSHQEQIKVKMEVSNAVLQAELRDLQH